MNYFFKNKLSNQCEVILYVLVLTLVFEGIIRKVLHSLSTPIFFFKDFLCIIGLFLVSRWKFPGVVEKIRSIWTTLFILFLPLLFFTGWKDVLLAVFASKQYLLYPVTIILVTVAFPYYKEERFRKFIFFTTLLLVPTTIVAVLQNSLPATHWLNVSVGGESLEAFSAAGYLRVGSTFSFTGQYSWFLNAEAFFLVTSFFMPPYFKEGLCKQFKSIIYPFLVLLLVASAFITGGRTAVLGCGATLALGFLFIAVKRPGFLFSKVLPAIFLFATCLFALRAVKPEFFFAYDQRSSGTVEITHNQEISNRIFGEFTGWTNWFWEQDPLSVLFGNGLGIMSNGSVQISSYALKIRSSGFWTEDDVPTTLWEGGLYLAIIWYGFRLLLILLSYRLWSWIKIKINALAASVPLAFVIVQGLIAPFGIQPPLFIWWAFAIGILVTLYRFEKDKVLATDTTFKNRKHEEKSHFH